MDWTLSQKIGVWVIRGFKNFLDISQQEMETNIYCFIENCNLDALLSDYSDKISIILFYLALQKKEG